VTNNGVSGGKKRTERCGDSLHAATSFVTLWSVESARAAIVDWTNGRANELDQFGLSRLSFGQQHDLAGGKVSWPIFHDG